MTYPAAVISISDRAVADPAEDRAAPIVAEGIEARGHEVVVRDVIANTKEAARNALTSAIEAGARIIFTVGSTGFGPADIAEDVTREFIDFELPGLLEEVRRRGAEHQPVALLSRGVVGVIREPSAVLVINSPGTRGGARDVLDVVADLLDYIMVHLDGGTCRPPLVTR